MVDRRALPLLAPEEWPAPPKATDLSLDACGPELARALILEWHSRLPLTQPGPWKLSFVATYRGTCFAAALWNNPSARTLPNDWLELRRMAVAPDAPHCTASWFLAQMATRIRRTDPSVSRLISYQDEAVHKGTIYKAAGWIPAYRSKARVRDRSGKRVGTNRMYRCDLNGTGPAASPKTRWELVLREEGCAA